MASRKIGIAIAVTFLVCRICLAAVVAEPRNPGPEDRCAVCGMFVHKYTGWVATVLFADGSQAFFDGPKDLFHYLLNLEKYRADRREISAVLVTDYYRVRFIDARTAYFVAGSNVMGPMGGELVPLEKREDAETFARDHTAGEILQFSDVTQTKIPK